MFHFQPLIIRIDLFLVKQKEEEEHSLECIVFNHSSDNPSIHRRPVIERRDHDNPLLFNYDGTICHPYMKYTTCPNP